VAPKDQPASDLVLRNIQEALNDPASAKDLEQATNMSREQIEQFVEKYRKATTAAAGPGRDITVKPGEQTPVAPSADLPGLDTKTRFSSKNVRNRGTMPQDDVHGNLEDVRFQPPPEMQGKFEAYKNKLSKVVASKRPANATPRSGSTP
jgi:hypothetical protein